MSIYLCPSRALGLKRWIKGAQETWFDLCHLCSFHMLYLDISFLRCVDPKPPPPPHPNTHTTFREILWSLLGMHHLPLITPSQYYYSCCDKLGTGFIFRLWVNLTFAIPIPSHLLLKDIYLTKLFKSGC